MRTWAYVGFEASGLFSAKLPPQGRVDLSAAINAAAAALREPYLAWVGRLDERHAADPDWWTTQVCEKNPLASPLFFQLAALKALREAKGLPDLIVCDSPELASAAGSVYKGQVRCARRVSLEPAKALARSLQFAARAAAALARRSPLSIAPSGRPQALLVTYVDEGSFSADGLFRERYLTGLRETLEARGYDVYLLAKPLEPGAPRRTLLARMRASAARFLVAEDYLTARDYAEALKGSRRSLSLPREAPPLDGLETGVLLEAERRRQARSVEAMNARLFRLLPARLAQAGLSPRLIVSWFENQKEDKAFALGARAAFSKADHAGYVSFLPSPGYTTALTTPAQVAARALPDRLVCCGARQAALFKGVPVSVGAALRYRYLWELPPASPSRDALVVLPSRLWESAELLAALAPVTHMETGVSRWLVKTHPDYTLAQLRRYLGDSWPEGLTLFEGSVREGLSRAGVVVSGGSGAAVEAACAGIPVALVGRLAGLDYEPLGWFPDVAPTLRSPEELAARIRRCLALTDKELAALKERGAELRRQCFEAVTPESLAAFVAGGPALAAGGTHR